MDVCFVTGSEPLATQAKYLSRSIRQFGDFNQEFVFIPEEEYSHIPEGVITELDKYHTIIEGQIPISDYQISSKIKGVIESERYSSADIIAFLDTDTLVLDDLSDYSLNRAKFSASPVDVVTDKYWTSDESRNEWLKFEQYFGLNETGSTVVSLVDKRECRPYYNAGVLFFQPPFGKEWLNWTNRVYHRASRKRNSDQVSLGLLSQKYECSVLSQTYNFPVPHRIYFPSDVKVLHYHQLPHLIRILTPELKKKLKMIGVLEEIQKYYTLRSLVGSSYGFKKPIKGRIGRGIKRISTNLFSISRQGKL